MEEKYDDLEVTVAYNPSTASVEFRCYEIIGHAQDEKGNFSVPLYEKMVPEDYRGSVDNVEDIKEAQTLLHGMVKWDGCSHYWFGDKQGYIHLCGGRMVNNLGKIMNKIYNRCGEIMDNAGEINVDETEFPIE